MQSLRRGRGVKGAGNDVDIAGLCVQSGVSGGRAESAMCTLSNYNLFRCTSAAASNRILRPCCRAQWHIPIKVFSLPQMRLLHTHLLHTLQFRLPHPLNKVKFCPKVGYCLLHTLIVVAATDGSCLSIPTPITLKDSTHHLGQSLGTA